MYTRILVATGGSPWSHAALTYAVALAVRMEAHLHILTALTLPASYDSGANTPPLNLMMASRENAGKDLLEASADRALQANVSFTTHCIWGGIPATILRTASDETCDLIVLGSRQVAGSQRRTLGRIANVVAIQAPQPVLVVKRPQAPSAMFGRRLLVATGGSPWSDAAVDHALKLAQSQDLEVCLLHVECDTLKSDKAPTASEGKNILTRAEARAAAAGVAYKGILASGSIPHVLLETATQQNCSAMVLGSRAVLGWKRPLLGHIASMIAARSAVPALIVKHVVPR